MTAASVVYVGTLLLLAGSTAFFAWKTWRKRNSPVVVTPEDLVEGKVYHLLQFYFLGDGLVGDFCAAKEAVVVTLEPDGEKTVLMLAVPKPQLTHLLPCSKRARLVYQGGALRRVAIDIHA